MDALPLLLALFVGLALAAGVVRLVNAEDKARASQRTPKKPGRSEDEVVRLRREDRALLIPRIRTHGYIDKMRARGATGENAIVYEALAGELIVAFALDRADMFRMVTERDLPHLELDRAELRAIAIQNLARLPEAGGRFEDVGEFGALVLEDLAATMLLVDGVWSDLQKTIRGEQLASVPSRDVLMIADSHFPAARKMLREEARHAFGEAGDTAISPQILVRRGGSWEIYETDDAGSDDEE